MADAVTIIGLKGTQASLFSVIASIDTLLPGALKMLGKMGVEDARGKVPVYTKALHDSIHYTTDKKPGELSVSVIAGDPNVIEGEGAYAFPAGANYPVMPTDEYAEMIDNVGGKDGYGKGYMTIEAYGKLAINAPMLINELIHEIVSRV